MIVRQTSSDLLKSAARENTTKRRPRNAKSVPARHVVPRFGTVNRGDSCSLRSHKQLWGFNSQSFSICETPERSGGVEQIAKRLELLDCVAYYRWCIITRARAKVTKRVCKGVCNKEAYYRAWCGVLPGKSGVLPMAYYRTAHGVLPEGR